MVVEDLFVGKDRFPKDVLVGHRVEEFVHTVV